MYLFQIFLTFCLRARNLKRVRSHCSLALQRPWSLRRNYVWILWWWYHVWANLWFFPFKLIFKYPYRTINHAKNLSFIFLWVWRLRFLELFPSIFFNVERFLLMNPTLWKTAWAAAWFFNILMKISLRNFASIYHF